MKGESSEKPIKSTHLAFLHIILGSPFGPDRSDRSGAGGRSHFLGCNRYPITAIQYSFWKVMLPERLLEPFLDRFTISSKVGIILHISTSQGSREHFVFFDIFFDLSAKLFPALAQDFQHLCKILACCYLEHELFTKCKL